MRFRDSKHDDHSQAIWWLLCAATALGFWLILFLIVYFGDAK